MLKPGSLSTGALLTALVAFGPMSTDLYLPSLPAMTAAFDADVSQVQLTLSMFVVGFAVAQLIYGPISDRFGRRPTMLVGLLFYFAASVGALFAETIEALIVWRFVQAIGAGAGPVLGRAVVRDLYDASEAAKVLAFMGGAMALAPAVAPILGGQLQIYFGWQASFVALAIFGGLVLVFTFKMLNETNRYRDPLALDPGHMLRNYAMLLRNRAFVGYTLVIAFCYSALFSFISGSSFVLIDVVGVSTELFGFCFGAVVVGYIAGSVITGKLSSRFSANQLIAFGSLYAVMSAAFLATFAWMGITTVWAVVAPMAALFMALAFCLPTGTAAVLAPFPRTAGSTSALMGFLQLSTGAMTGIAVGHLHDGTARPMATIILVATALAFLSYLFVVPKKARS